MTHLCKHCKTEFERNRENQFYCSQSCRQLAYMARKYSGNQQRSAQTAKTSGIDLTGLLGAIQPETLIQLLSNVINNPSMTDKLTDKKEKPANTYNSQENPSQNVNDGFRDSDERVLEYRRKTSDYLKKSVSKTSQIRLKREDQSMFNYMVQENLTIPIPPKGYVRGLFPQWSEKEWRLSLNANKKTIALFSCLENASQKNTITCDILTNCREQLYELCDGIYGIFLPDDYPFRKFIRQIYDRLTVLLQKSESKKEIRFKIPDELSEQMAIIIVQTKCDK